MEFIEFRLFWEGHVNRSDIVNAFGVSIPQASTDLNRYLDIAPANMAYDKSAKAYVRGPDFSPRFLSPDADRYLAQLRSVSDGILDQGETWIGQLPGLGATPALVRSVNPKVLRAVIAAIRRGEALEILYQSMSQPEPRWRWIAPHAIGFDGFRWHARAHSEGDDTFKDFVLSRILETRAIRPATADGNADLDWIEDVVLEIAPHPGLSPSQQRTIALDYGMTEGKSKVRVRRALLYYALKRLGLDTAPDARRPQDQHIVLINRDEVDSLTHKREESV
ncbi:MULTISPECIES: WYL domain-containing protein [Azospirillum]|uniref:WYL domain-containing protein n=1 Tax=Azospirillum isscasi TaxID=3053926 RepID=A0ABU0WJN7_9PROT|nr:MULTISPECIES: WYL domain-containing protein [Azospirillum]MDQ2104428.1 WYL domain-containing protein [Azospirillum isscasi]